MKWIGQNIYDNLALFRNNVRIGGGNVYGGDGSSNNWLMIDCQDGDDASGGGITFHEATLSGAVDFDTPQFGAKIVYNEDDDEFSIGTITSGTYKKQIKMDRDSNNVDFIQGATFGGGYGSTGTTISGGGVGQFNGALTTDGALTGASISTAGNLTVSGTSNNTISGTTSFTSSGGGRPAVEIKNTGNNTQGGSFKFVLDKGAAGADNDIPGTMEWMGDDEAQAQVTFGQLYTQVADATDEQEAGAMYLKVAAYDGVLETGLKLDGDTNADGEVDVTIGTGAASVTTVAGTLTMGSTAAMTNAGLLSVANQSNITGVGTISSGEWRGTVINGAYIADDAVTFAKASGVSPNIFGNVIKLIPSDFGVNDDGGNTKFGVGYIEVAGTGYGMRSPNSNAELFAFVSIPEGMKATHVNIHAKSTYSTEVFEVQIDGTTVSSKGTGNCNTNLDITDVNATATNFLAIMVSITATTDKVYGGAVTIAAQ